MYPPGELRSIHRQIPQGRSTEPEKQHGTLTHFITYTFTYGGCNRDQQQKPTILFIVYSQLFRCILGQKTHKLSSMCI